MMKIINKIKEHKDELGFWGAAKWFFSSAKFRFLLFSSRLFVSKREGNIDLKKKEKCVVLKESRQRIFIFAGVPFYDVGGGQRSAQFAKTFNSFGYEVYYFFSHASSETKIYKMKIPTSVHKGIDDIKYDYFAKVVRPGDLVIVEFPDPKFIEYLKIAREKKAKIVYENIDNWETSLGGSIFSKDKLYEIIELSNVLVGTAKTLVKQLEDYCKELGIKKKIFYEPNAVDDSLFNTHRRYIKPKDFIEGEKTLIYYGSLWLECFDWDLVYGIAKKFPNYSILLIGEYKHLGQRLQNAPKNVHFLGIKKQSDLPAYLYYSDFALMPFKVGRFSESVSPLKIFEYLAMGKIVLSTRLPEVIKFPNMIIGDTVEEWAKGIKQSKDADLDASTLFVSENNWYCRCANILLNVGIFEKKVSDEYYGNISIVVVSNSQSKDLFGCLKRLICYSVRYKYEIIVIGRTGDSVRKKFRKRKNGNGVRFLENNEKNKKDWEVGVKSAKHDYVLILNSNQCVLNHYWLDCYLYIMGKNKKSMGAIGNKNGQEITQIPTNGLYKVNINCLDFGAVLTRKTILNIDNTELSLSSIIRDAGYDLAYSPYLGVD